MLYHVRTRTLVFELVRRRTTRVAPGNFLLSFFIIRHVIILRARTSNNIFASSKQATLFIFSLKRTATKAAENS